MNLTQPYNTINSQLNEKISAGALPLALFAAVGTGHRSWRYSKDIQYRYTYIAAFNDIAPVPF